MKRTNSLLRLTAASIVLFLTSCSKNETANTVQTGEKTTTATSPISENGTNPDESAIAALAGGAAPQANAVSGSVQSNSSNESESYEGKHFLYTESNGTAGNQILVYKIGSKGVLQWVGASHAGGKGTGAGLGSQGALALADEHEMLFAVNAGSNSVSSFIINDDGTARLAHTEYSGGKTPISLSTKGNLLFVLNAGSDSIQGFRIKEDGSFKALPGSARGLSGTGVGAAEIAFSPSGERLLITEKGTNKISTFKVNADGSIWYDEAIPATGVTPYGFAFARSRYAIVSNAVGGATDAGSATSYAVGIWGLPKEVNGAVANDQSAPCWVATTEFGRFAFVTNTASNSISSYYISDRGELWLIHGSAASTDSKPTDIVVAKNNYNVYELNAGGNSIGEYYRTPLGGLTALGTVSGLPAGTVGLVSF